MKKTKIIDNTIQPGVTVHVVVLGKERQIVQLNRAAQKLAGSNASALLGENCQAICLDKTQLCATCPVIQTLQTKVPTTTIIHTPDARRWHITTNPMYDDSGIFSGVSKMYYELSEG